MGISDEAQATFGVMSHAEWAMWALRLTLFPRQFGLGQFAIVGDCLLQA
jgi:hypothetical protein